MISAQIHETVDLLANISMLLSNILKQGFLLCHEYSAMRMHEVELSTISNERSDLSKLLMDSFCVLNVIARSYS